MGVLVCAAVFGIFVSLRLSADDTAILRLEMSLGISGGSKAQVFWAGREEGFAAERAVSFDVKPGPATYKVLVPADPGRLRIDPLSGPGTVAVRSIRLTRWGIPLCTWGGRQGFVNWSPLTDLTDMTVRNGALHMTSTGTDPAFASGALAGLSWKRQLVDGAISLVGGLSLAALLIGVMPSTREAAAGIEIRALLVRTGRSLAELVAILALGAGLTEGAMRVYQHFVPVFIFPSEGTNRFRGKPFSPDYDDWHLNSHGFKDVEFEKQKRPGTVRILGLGDSFAFGVVPYQYNYLTLLEQDLRSMSPPAEVINMGIPSTGPNGYLEVLVSEGLPLNADMVLVSFFIGNDFTDEEPPPPRSYLYAFARFVFMPKPKGVPIHGAGVYRDDGYSFEPDKYLEIERQRCVIFRRSNPAFAGQGDSVRATLERMERLCRNKGLELQMVVIPDEMQVNAGLQAEVVASYPGAEADFDFTLPNRRLRADLQGLGIRYLDLLERFKEAGSTQRLYRLRDTHWNIAGNRLAASLIRDELLSGGMKFWQRPDR